MQKVSKNSPPYALFQEDTDGSQREMSKPRKKYIYMI